MLTFLPSTPAPQTLALAAHTARAFGRLVAARALPEDFIVRVMLLAQGAVWVGRMVVLPEVKGPALGNGNGNGKDKNGKSGAKGKRNKSAAEDGAAEGQTGNAAEKGKDKEQERVRRTRPSHAAHLAHLLALHTALLAVGVRELGEVDTYAHPAAVVPTPAVHNHAGGRGAGGGRGRRGGRRAEVPGAGVVAGATPAAAGAVGGGRDAGAGLAERISAEFRRTLPALRVATKWIVGNWGWVREGEAAGRTTGEKRGGDKDEEDEEAELVEQRVRFWATYAEFLRRLARTFPVGLLPKLTAIAEGGEVDGEDGRERGDGEEVELELELEEDVDMRGWLPLRGLMGGPCPLPAHLAGDAPASDALSEAAEHGRRTVGQREEVHPNEEQLMRIADLLRDARRVVGLEVGFHLFWLPSCFAILTRVVLGVPPGAVRRAVRRQGCGGCEARDRRCPPAPACAYCGAPHSRINPRASHAR